MSRLPGGSVAGERETKELFSQWPGASGDAGWARCVSPRAALASADACADRSARRPVRCFYIAFALVEFATVGRAKQ
jgi:hypothetical protein